MHNDRLATMWGGIVTETTQWVVFEKVVSFFIFFCFVLFCLSIGRGESVQLVEIVFFVFLSLLQSWWCPGYFLSAVYEPIRQL
jgi:hypothetical protein